MNTTEDNHIEDRLVAALAARADLVQPEDLRVTTPPHADRPLLRGPKLLMVAAAAGIAVLGVPAVLSLSDDEPDRQVIAESPAPAPSPVAGAGWPRVAASSDYDLDGDGVPDPVVTRTESGEALTQDPWRVEARLSSGVVAAVLLSGGGWEIVVDSPVDLDGDAGDEILYYNGRETEEMGVLDLRDGALVDLAVPADPGITSMNDDQDRMRSRWVADGVLHSARSVEGGFVPGDGGKQVPAQYPVDVWSWTLRDGQLVPVEVGRWCAGVGVGDQPAPC